jgi:hypothetical protein
MSDQTHASWPVAVGALIVIAAYTVEVVRFLRNNLRRGVVSEGPDGASVHHWLNGL